MRHILIFLSLLLLSSPVIGDNHKGETLYGWGKCCDYKWMGFGEKDTHPKYQGQVKDGKFHGQGTKTWSDGMYVGKDRDGKLSTGIFYNKNRNISFKVVNGRMIKQ